MGTWTCTDSCWFPFCFLVWGWRTVIFQLPVFYCTYFTIPHYTIPFHLIPYSTYIARTPQLPFKRPQIPSNRDYMALNRATVGGLGIYSNIPYCSLPWGLDKRPGQAEGSSSFCSSRAPRSASKGFPIGPQVPFKGLL